MLSFLSVEVDILLKVQMKCFFLLLNLKEQQKSGRSPFTVSLYLFQFQSYNGLKMSSFRSKSGQNTLSKSIKINKICDVMCRTY